MDGNSIMSGWATGDDCGGLNDWGSFTVGSVSSSSTPVPVPSPPTAPSTASTASPIPAPAVSLLGYNMLDFTPGDNNIN